MTRSTSDSVLMRNFNAVLTPFFRSSTHVRERIYSRAATRNNSERVICSFSASFPISSQRDGGTDIDRILLDLISPLPHHAVLLRMVPESSPAVKRAPPEHTHHDA